MADVVPDPDSQQPLALPIAPSTRRADVARRVGLRRLPIGARRYTALIIEINRVFQENFGAHGVRRVWRQLDQEGIEVDRYTVAKLMRTMGLQSGVRSADGEITCSEQSSDHPGSGQPETGLNESEHESVVTSSGNVYNLFPAGLKMVSGRRR